MTELIDRIFYAASDPHSDPAPGFRLSDLFDCDAVLAAERALESAEGEDQFNQALGKLKKVVFVQGFRMGMRLAREVEA